MKSSIIKRSVTIAEKKTSVSLEDEFWTGLKCFAMSRNLHISSLVEEIDLSRSAGNLSSALRLSVLAYYRSWSASGPAADPQSHHDVIRDNRHDLSDN